MKRSQTSLKVPTAKTPAVLALINGDRAQVSLHIAPGRGIGDLLSGPHHFVPVHFAISSRLVARTSIAWICVHPMHVAVGALPEENQRVRLRLRCGAQVSGNLRWVARPGQRRTLDHLNDDRGYIELFEDHEVRFVSKEHVLEVEELPC